MLYEEDELNINKDDCDSEDKVKNQQSFLTTELIFEITIMCLFPMPHYDIYIQFSVNELNDTTYFLGEFLFVCMFMRSYFLIQSLLSYSVYKDSYASELCRAYGFTPSFFFNIKS